MNELIRAIQENRSAIIRDANRWINIPVIPERIEAILIGLVLDALMIAIENVIGSPDVRADAEADAE